MKTILTTGCFLLFGFSISISAQESINAAGVNLSGSNGKVTSSIGQTFYETSASSSGSVSAGAQQSYEITETLGSEIAEINLSLKIYPNPTPDILYLKVGFNDCRKYRYELFDGSGKVLTGRSVNEAQTSISMSSYPAAVYYLKIAKEGKVVKIFKVLKTDK
ncbi:T9SS type A sorting domain-containing protein [Epilithonimonas sp.]|uniref:T9SS type A sorting domain-containing protein n=1 Tax=Epilithonimonas sp. TaxID=2894511 RepID=UPI0028A1A88C|nr:T9SS type A sorting domain-containing protein [Epilithonimonas sp.]